jgi:F0F1-type ATP synthase assembly protein I
VWRVFLIIALVIGFLIGGLLFLRSSAKTRVPPEIVEKARKREAEKKAEKKGSDLFSEDD